MRTTFYIPENKLIELKIFIRDNLKTLRFLQNPYKIGDEYGISIEISIEDYNKLAELRNSWYIINNKKINFWNKLKQIFN